MALDPAVKKELEELVRDAEKAGIVVGMQRVLRKLQELRLLRVQQIEPAYIGCHDQNRDGYGLSPEACHQLLEDIASVGFDARQTDPICADIDPAALDAIFKFNSKLAKTSCGLLPEIAKHELRYASLSASHTNAALRCIMAGTPHESSSKLVVNGKLQLEQVKEVDPEMAIAAMKGLTWRVISSEALSVKGLADIIQAGANTTAQLARGESEFQMVRRILNSINAHGGSGQTLIFANVRQAIMRTKPQCHESIPEIFKFLTRFGASPHLQDRILRTEERIKRSQVPARNLGAAFFRTLSQDPRDPQQDTCTFFRHAVLALAYCCKDSSVNSNDLKKLTAKKDDKTFMKVLQGQQLLRKIYKDLGKAIKQEDMSADCWEAVEQFEDRVVCFCLEKKMAWESLDAAACVLVDRIEELTQVKISPDYTASRPAPEPTQASSSKAEGVLNLWLCV